MDFAKKLVIDHTEDQRVVIDEHYRVAQRNLNILQYLNNHDPAGVPTWFRRECVRLHLGIYTQTDALEAICRAHEAALMMVPHIALGDRTMVAYTPTREAGNEDKQLTTTFAKFMAKVNILLTDNYIQQRESEHRAEINGVYHVATDPDKISYVYQHMDGDSGCMRYAPEQWGLPNDIHPSMVYSAPNMGVAYTEDSAGNIKSRAVIYTNGDDKRYVRIYGDRVLEKMLKRDGYVCKSLAGLRLAKIPYPGRENTYVCPYIDGPGGNQSSEPWAKYVYLDGDYLRVPDSNDQVRQIQQFGENYIGSASHTGARLVLNTVPNLEYECALTGIKYNRLKDRAVNFFGVGGIVEVNADNLEDRATNEHQELLSARVSSGEKTIVFYFGKRSVFNHRGITYFDTPLNRLTLGYTQITWGLRAGEWSAMTKTVVDRNLKQQVVGPNTDHVRLFPASGEPVVMIATEFAEYRRAHKFVRCPNVHESEEAYISPARPTMVKTTTGKYIDTVAHASGYVNLYGTNQWAARRSAQQVNLYGQVVWMSKDIEDFSPYKEALFKTSRYYAAMSKSREAVVHSFGSGVSLDTLRTLRYQTIRNFAYGILNSGGTLIIGETVVYSYDAVTYETLEDAWSRYKDETENEPWFAIGFRDSYGPLRNLFLEIIRDIDGTIERVTQQAAGQLTIEEGVAA